MTVGGSVPAMDASLRPRLLIADDDAAIRKMIRTVFELDGYEVLEAEDSTVAWSLVQTHQPAIAILDVQMPGETGLELCRKIKEKGFRRTKVVIYTASMASEEEAIRAGGDAFFLKSVSLSQLRTAVRQLSAVELAV